MGIISATGRGGLDIEKLEDFIQTDAAINPGNSGGALVNVNGELIGINTAILTGGGGGNQGIGFAIPVNMARAVMDQILKHGKVMRGWIEVEIQNVTSVIAKSFKLSGGPRGALVADVSPDSPAQRAGLQRGDIVLELDGQHINDSRSLGLKIAMLLPDKTVNLKVWRNGALKDIAVTLAEQPGAGEKQAGETAGAGVPKIGVSVQTLTSDTARQLNLPP